MLLASFLQATASDSSENATLAKSAGTETESEFVQQQKKTISGNVTDESGQALPGVSIFVKRHNCRYYN